MYFGWVGECETGSSSVSSSPVSRGEEKPFLWMLLILFRVTWMNLSEAAGSDAGSDGRGRRMLKKCVGRFFIARGLHEVRSCQETEEKGVAKTFVIFDLD